MKRGLLLLLVILLFSGCIQNNLQNQIKIEVNPEKIRYGDDVRIKIFFTNTLSNKIKNVKIKIDNLSLLNFKKIEKCPGIIKDNACFIESIEPEDEINVVFLFKTPRNIFSEEKEIKPSFLISYDYSSQSLWKIPIFNDNYKGEEKEIIIQISDGPVEVKIRNLNENKKFISDEVYTMIIDLVNKENGICMIKKGDFELRLEGFKIFRNDENICDFVGDTILHFNEDINLLSKKTFFCSFRTQKTNAWDYGKLIFNYKYTYNINHIVELKIEE